MKLHKAALLSGLIATSVASPSYAINIEFDYTLDEENFFANNTAKSLLETAGAYFSNLITDDLNSVLFTSNISLPSSAVTTSKTVVSAADTLTVFVGGVNLSGGTLGQAGPSWSNSNDSRGEIGHTGSSATATDFAPLYGVMSFAANRSDWYFDTDLAVDEVFTGYDFYSVALHEIGHVLGISTAPSWDHLINASGEFIGEKSVAVHGDPIATVSNDHWAFNTTSTINGVGSFETAMDPNIAAGIRKEFTDLDIAALDDIGWDINSDVSAVPVPPAIWLMGSAMIALFRFRKVNR